MTRATPTGPYKSASGVEIRFRDLVSKRGLRFLTDSSVPCGEKSNGQNKLCVPDVLFREFRLAVFLDGCYWHRCEQHGPNDARAAAIRRKDEDIDEGLRLRGWSVLRFWEHEDLDAAAERVLEAVLDRHATRKLIHFLPAACEHPDSEWCDGCDSEPHAFVGPTSATRCARCDGARERHTELVLDQLQAWFAALGEDFALVNLRYGLGRKLGIPEMREIAAAARHLAAHIDDAFAGNSEAKS